MPQQLPRSARWAGVFLLVAVAGSVVLMIGEASSWPLAASLLGFAAVLAGVIGVAVIGYQNSRRTGAGVLRSLGRMTWAAIRLSFDLTP